MNPLLKKIEVAIVTPIIRFMVGLALVYFLWGIVEYLIHGDEPEARATGTQHMIWGLVGLAIMLSVYGIMTLIINTIGAK